MATATKNGKTKNRVANVAEIRIPALNQGRLTFDLVGISPLVVHNFDEKSTQQMLEKQQKKATKQKEARCPEEEYLRALYWVSGNMPTPTIDKETGEKKYDPKKVKSALQKATFGIPASGFRNAIVSAGRNVGLNMTNLRQMLFTYGADDVDWAIIKSKQLPEIDRRIVRINKKIPMERFRPKWTQWETSIIVEFDRNSLSAEEVANLLNVAGNYVGICEGRPENCALGWGRFRIK